MTIEALLERIAVATEATHKLLSTPQVPQPPGPEAPPPVSTTVIPAVQEPRKRGRPPKVEAPAAPPAADIDFGTESAESDSFLDIEDVAPAKTYTREQVRDALVAYQKKTSAEVARRLLTSAAGHVSLKALPEADFGKVIDAIAKA